MVGEGVGYHKPIIGLSGGVGAGKSTVANAFAREGCVIIDSDRLNHEILARPEVLSELQGWWGPEVMTPEGKPDRSRIARIIFADGREKQRLESLVHPLIARERNAIISRSNTDQVVKAIILDSPLLFESSLDRLCDHLVFVDTSKQQRLARLRRERSWDADQLAQREGWQLSLDEKRKRSGFVVENEGSIEQLRGQVVNILDRILA